MEQVFRALADPSRRLILDRLLERDGQTLGELCGHLPSMTRFGVMDHLRVLEGATLVTTLRDGRRKLHYLNPVPIRQIHDRWIDRFTEPVVGHLAALTRHLEEESMSGPDHVYVTYIKAAPERVWQAMTDPELTARYYYGTRIASTFEPGSPFEYHNPDGTLAADGTILEAERPTRLVFSFQARWSQELVDEGPVRMTWLVEPAGEGTSRLTVTSEGMGPRTAEEFIGGIPAITAGLKTLLETGDMLVLATA